LIAHDGINDAERKPLGDETTLAVTPNDAEARMLKQEADGVLELCEERLG
jgi:hypothetical protein